MAMLDYRRANGFPEKTSLFELNFIKHLAISSGSRKTHHLPANVGRYTMHHHGPIGRLRSKCNAPSLKFLLFQLDHSSFFFRYLQRPILSFGASPGPLRFCGNKLFPQDVLIPKSSASF